MKGRAFIERLRARGEQLVATRAEQALLADAVEEADGSFRDLIQSECVMASSDATVAGDVLTISRPWWDTSRILDGCGGEIATPPGGTLTRAISYLERRGLIERKEGEPHMVRFVE